MRLYDAHNHLMDERFEGTQDVLVAQAVDVGMAGMVVNGSCVADWDAVADLARRFPAIVPAYGLHPWYLPERPETWESDLEARLAADPRATVGEIGIDRWILDQPAERRARYHPDLAQHAPAPMEVQAGIFRRQMEIAARWERPVSIHCLHAWGTLLDLLRSTPLPAAGFLLHSYGGPAELVRPLADLGAHFGFPGCFLHPRKARQQEVFRRIPLDRLLTETDAPDQPLPEDPSRRVFQDSAGREWNVPANLRNVHLGLAGILAMDQETLAESLERNFRRLFGGTEAVTGPSGGGEAASTGPASG